MKEANTRVVLVKKCGSWTCGFDREEDLAQVPHGYSGYIWTDRIDTISAAMQQKK